MSAEVKLITLNERNHGFKNFVNSNEYIELTNLYQLSYELDGCMKDSILSSKSKNNKMALKYCFISYSACIIKIQVFVD